MKKETSLLYFITISLFIFIFLFAFPKTGKGYEKGRSIYCSVDCFDENCGPANQCVDDQPGCIVECAGEEELCPSSTPCAGHTFLQKFICSYSPVKPTTNLSVNKKTIIRGESVTLSWSVTPRHTQYCKITAGGNIVKVVKPDYDDPASGTITVFPTQTTTYKLHCENTCRKCADKYTCWDATSSDESSVTITVQRETNPNVPTLVSPPNNSWQNQTPTFEARVSDNDGDRVKAYFQIIADLNGNSILDENEIWEGYGNLVSSGNISSWTPSNLPDFYPFSWKAKAIDEDGRSSGWSGWWQFGKDTIPPQAQISYNLECASSTNFPVSLTESDELSGIDQGQVQISINGGSWQNYKTTTEDFTYPGQEGTTYQFRYKVTDKAGNSSDWATGPAQTLSVNRAPSATNLTAEVYDPCSVPYTGALLSWTFSDPDGDPQFARRVQIDDNSSFSSPEVDNYAEVSNNAYASQVGDLKCYTTYYWRLKVWDSPCKASSSWIQGPSFTTVCDYPDVDFTWQPEKIYFSQPIQFTDQSICYDEIPIDGKDCSSEEPQIDSFNWQFVLTKEDEWGETQTLFETSTTTENPTITLPYLGDLKITLTVTDSQGRSCSKTVDTSSRFPVWIWKTWREINPACFWL
ncbi:hypothetical protein J7L85_03385, partial [candidate division WOR-3 bacterium]|nr:hypothetical protein [candidate division WOR-3 bacterium]